MRIHDGAYGTLLGSHLHGDETVDDLCLRAPQLVVDAHRAYLEAGAGAIQTNAFLVHLRGSERRRRELRTAALACAREAAATADVEEGAPLVVATIGPDGGGEERAFWEPIEQALDAEARAVLCETVTDAKTARAFAAAWREVAAGVRDVEVLLGCSVSPSAGAEACRWTTELAGELDDAIQLGLNCCEGPLGLRPVLEAIAEERGTTWAMPSAGLPVAGGPGEEPVRWPFAAPADWVEATLEAIDDLPVAALGGCCGTSPDTIAALRSP